MCYIRNLLERTITNISRCCNNNIFKDKLHVIKMKLSQNKFISLIQELDKSMVRWFKSDVWNP